MVYIANERSVHVPIGISTHLVVSVCTQLITSSFSVKEDPEMSILGYIVSFPQKPEAPFHPT